MSDEKKDYKNTLNLPETTFPMQAGLAKTEPERLQRWEASALYATLRAQAAGKPMFWLVDGPPYANGDIHIGHAVNKVLKDIVVKSARLSGFDAPYVPGWDCHGLPIELQVEKKHGKVGDKLDAKTFRQKCREYAHEQIGRQRDDFKRLGILGDWEKPYLTMQPAFEAEQLRSLAKIVERGHVVRGYKPVHWCLDCGSSLAEAEVEYEDKQSTAVDVGFRAVDAAEVAKRFGVKTNAAIEFVIWTTTPWTLPANQAVCVNAELDYALVKFGERHLVLAAELATNVCKRYGGEGVVLASIKGAALENLKLAHPFATRTVPVICGEHVTLETGTGLVHTAPAHGVEDFVVGKQYKLAVDNPVASNGVFITGTPVVAGQFVRKAEEPILAALTSAGALLHKATITHSYPHCWRHKTPLIFRATPQWFISMEEKGLRQQALTAIRRTNWIPAWGEARIHEMIEGRPDWCISRQRYWGVPLALLMHKEKGTLHPQMPALLSRIAEKVEAEGLEAWFGSSVSDWLTTDADQYEKCTDTLDVWFDSGVVHQCAFKSTGFAIPDYAKLDAAQPGAKNGAGGSVFYLEGSDQHRGWFHSSLLARVAMDGHPPYTHVLTHGFTVDEQGRKMSKSLGNVVAPQTVTKTLGADVLRLWVAASDYSGEIAISDNLLKRMSDAYRRIRNTARYLLSNLHGFDPAKNSVAPEAMLAVDRWALAQAARLQDEIKKAYGEWQFHRVYHLLHNYCVTDLGGLYLDILKDRLYTTPADSVARRSAQTALFHIAEALVRWIAPVLSFTADEIWELLPGDRKASVFSMTWHQFPSIATEAPVDWSRLLVAREAVKKALEDSRIKGDIGSGLDADVTLRAGGDMLKALQQPGDELRFWFITSAIRVEPTPGEELAVSITPIAHAKCDRCWHRRADIGAHAEHPLLCARCVSNIEGAGETRRFI